MAKWNTSFQARLSEESALQNAQNVATYCIKNGWHKNSISAICGNAFVESRVNPNMYEYGYAWEDDRGYGIFQWTPRSKLEKWCNENNLDFRSGEAQLARLKREGENNIQYYATNEYPDSFTDFRTNKNNRSVERLTKAFMYNYERPNLSVSHLDERIHFANLCYNKLKFDGQTSGKDKEENPEGYTEDKPIKEIISDGTFLPNLEIENITKENINNLITSFIKKLESTLNEILTIDLYKLSNYYYSNSFLTISKQLDNMYKIKPNIDFFKSVDKIVSTIKNTSGIDNNIITESPNDPKPPTKVTADEKPTESANENIKKMTDKAFSYPTASIPYSMNGARDMVSSGDCSSFVSHVLNAAGLNVGNGGTPDLYAIARDRGRLVVDGYQKEVESIIQKAREGDYILMAENSTFQYGGSSHVVYVYSSNGIRHQTSSGGGMGPINDKLDIYMRNARDYWAYRFALCRPFK